MSLQHITTRTGSNNALLVHAKKGSNKVRSFANATARDAAIPSPTRGFVIYNEELENLQVYDPRGFWRTLDRDSWLDRGKTVYDDDRVDAFVKAPAIVEPVEGGTVGSDLVRPGWQMADGPARVPGVKYGDGTIYLYIESLAAFKSLRYDTGGVARQVWLCNDGETIYWVYKQNGVAGDRMYRARIKSDDSGLVATQDLAFNLSTDGTVLQHQGLRQHGDTLIFVEYAASGLVEHNLKIWRGTTWGTWEAVYNLQYGHFHSVCYHAATGKWIAVAGDNEYNTILVSDDDGRTWSVLGDWFEQGYSHCKPVGLEDVGDLTRLLTGGDEHHALAWLDVVEGKIIPLANTLRDEPLGIGFVSDDIYQLTESYYFGLRQFGDLTLIANTPYGFRADHWGQIWATRDFKSFMPLYLVAEVNEFSMPMAVDRDGSLHCQTSGTSSANPFDTMITIPATSRFARRRLHNKTVNLLTPQQAELATAEEPAMWDVAGKVGIQYGSGPDGQNTMKSGTAVSATTDLTDTCVSDLVTVNGTTYHCRIKTYADGPAFFHQWKWYIDGAQLGQPKPAGYGAWTECNLFPFTADADGDAIGLFYNLRRMSDTFDDLTLEVTDCIICADQPGLYVPPGQPEPGTEESLARTAPADGWTHIYAIQPITNSKHYLNDCAIRTYKVDATNYAVLSWDAAGEKFLLTPTVAGTPGTPLEIAIEFFHASSTLYFAVRCRDESGEKWQLSLSNGGEWSHATEAEHAVGALDAPLLIEFDGTDGGHMTHDVIVDRFVAYMSDANLVSSEWHY